MGAVEKRYAHRAEPTELTKRPKKLGCHEVRYWQGGKIACCVTNNRLKQHGYERYDGPSNENWCGLQRKCVAFSSGLCFGGSIAPSESLPLQSLCGMAADFCRLCLWIHRNLLRL